MNFNVYVFDPLDGHFSRLAGDCEAHGARFPPTCDCAVVTVFLGDDLCSGTEFFSNKPLEERISMCDCREETYSAGATEHQVADEATRRGLPDALYRGHLLNLLRSQHIFKDHKHNYEAFVAFMLTNGVAPCHHILIYSRLCVKIPGFSASMLTELDPELNTVGPWDRLLRVLVRLAKENCKGKAVLRVMLKYAQDMSIPMNSLTGYSTFSGTDMSPLLTAGLCRRRYERQSKDPETLPGPEPKRKRNWRQAPPRAGAGAAAAAVALSQKKEPPGKTRPAHGPIGPCETVQDMPVCFMPSEYSTMGWFEVFLRKDVSFRDIADFCENPQSKVLLPGVPPRNEWTMHTPVMLMNDYGGKYRYVVTDATELSLVRPATKLQLNEVFLKNRPVNRLNIDVDAKVCGTCLPDDKLRTEKMLTWATDFLECVKKVFVAYGVGGDDLELEDCGKLRVYVRNNKKKYSGRLLWYPPVGLTFGSVTEVSKFLAAVLATATLRNQLKQYLTVDGSNRPVSFTCGRCIKPVRIEQEHGAPAPGAGGADKKINQFVIDMAPYSVHKSIRLPNAHKDEEPFKYVETINDHYAGDVEDFHSMAVGLSSLPSPPDTQKLAVSKKKSLPWTVREARAQFKPKTYDGTKNDYFEAHFAKLWGVPVTLHLSSNGLNIIQATEHTDSVACPDHKRVHTKNFPRVIILSENNFKYKCFKN